MELGLELEDESLHGSLSQEEDMDMVPFGGSSEVRDVRRRRFFLVHFPSVGLILTSLAALAIGALIGTFASGTRGGGMGVDTDTPGDASAPVELPPNLAPGRSFDGAAGNATSAHPALSDLVQNGEIVGDVDWELDFAIVGFPKCGTSYLMRYLALGEELYLNDHELCTLTFNDPVNLAKMYYDIDRVTEDGRRRVKVGLKCPKDFESDFGLQHYSQYWPTTDFVITTRHPVSWFQSFYNYRSYQHYPLRMPDPLDLIGECRDNHPGRICAHKITPKEECTKQNVCTDRSNFHYALSRFQKTPMNTTRELELLKGRTMDTMGGLKGRVFIMEVGQLALEGDAADRFTRDLSDYLGMEKPLPPFPGHTSGNEYEVEERRQDFMNICEDRYIPIRTELLKGGGAAAEWIRDYFLESDEVHVSQKEMFLDMIAKWSIDPCDNVEAL